MTTPTDDESSDWPWFETDDQGSVQRASRAAEQLGVAPGMPAPRAAAMLSALLGALVCREGHAGVWRIEPAPSDDGRRPEQRLLDLQARLQVETRRRRQLERQLINVTETEQRRISLELHDGLGQHLSGLAFTAKSLASRLEAGQHEAASEADWLARLLRDCVGRVRALSRGLWPVSLERESLPQALGALARDVEQLYGISVQVTAEDFEAESGHAAHHLFRIVQEAIHNALRHGRARHIQVRLERVPPSAMLSIVSDGAPVSADALNSARGLGLIGMRLRADALGGELSVEPLQAGGVEVCLVWRLAEASRAPTGRRPRA